MKTIVIFQWLLGVYPKLSSNCPVRKTVKGRQKPDFFTVTVPQGKKTTKKPTSVIAFLCGKNLLPNYNWLALPEVLEKLCILSTWVFISSECTNINNTFTSFAQMCRCLFTVSKVTDVCPGQWKLSAGKSIFSPLLPAGCGASTPGHLAPLHWPSSVHSSPTFPHSHHTIFTSPLGQLLECTCMHTDKNSPSPAVNPWSTSKINWAAIWLLVFVVTQSPSYSCCRGHLAHVSY